MTRKTGVYYAAGCVLLIVSIAVRIAAYPIIIIDYTTNLAKWFDILQAHPGMSAFDTVFYNYAPLYLYLLKILTFIPVYSLYSIKTLSVLFDVVTAVGVCAILHKITALNGAQRFLVFAVAFSIPTVVINSAVWAQSDASYTSLIVWSLFFMLSDNPVAAAISYGVAVAFKAQALFFLPVIAGYLFRQRSTWPYIGIIPAVYVATIVPAWLAGGPFFTLLKMYVLQANEFGWLNAFSPSIFAYFGEHPSFAPGTITLLTWAGIAAASLACSVIVVMVAVVRAKGPRDGLIFLALLSVLLIPYLLPKMHERYFYLADVLSVLYAFCRPRQWFVPVAVVTASFLCYMPFLSGQTRWFSHIIINDIRYAAALVTAVILSLLAQLRSVMINGTHSSSDHGALEA